MKLFSKNIALLISSVILGVAMTGCSGGGVCNPNVNPTPSPTPTVSPSPDPTASPAPDVLSLEIAAPNQYPAGVEVTAYLTITNTSTVNAENLYFTVPDVTNTTGATITIENGANQPCLNIESGQSCTFPALISANSHPGSFTVLATPNGASSYSRISNMFKTNTLELTAHIGLVDTPNTQNILYVLPVTQTINKASGENTTALVSVLVKNISDAPIQNIKLLDETGKILSASIVGTAPSEYGVNTVVTFAIHVANSVDLQKLQAVAYSNDAAICDLNDGTNNASACSNVAFINLSAQNTGILQVSPTLVYMSESYTSQVYTLTNVGQTKISSLTIPRFESPIAIQNQGNTCSNISDLAVNQSCQFTVTYTPQDFSKKNDYIFTYNNGQQAVQTEASIISVGTTLSALVYANPTSLSLTGNNPTQTVVFTNFGRGDATITGIALADSSVVESVSSTCSVGKVLKSSINSSDSSSCTYTVSYKASVSGTTSLDLDYSASGSSLVTSVPINYQGLMINATLRYGSPTGESYIGPAIAGDESLYVVFSMMNAAPKSESQQIQVDASSYILNPNYDINNCVLTYESPTCNVFVKVDTGNGTAFLTYQNLTNSAIAVNPESSILINVSTKYVYVANLANGDTALYQKNDIYKCLRKINDSSEIYDNCEAQNVPAQIGNQLFHPNSMTLSTELDTIYITDSSNTGNVVACDVLFNGNGDLTNCRVVGAPTLFNNAQSISIDDRIDDNNMSAAYISNQVNGIWGVTTCSLSLNDGSLSACTWANPFSPSTAAANLVGFLTVGNSRGSPLIESYENVSYYMSQPSVGANYGLYRSESINYDVISGATYPLINFSSSSIVNNNVVPSNKEVTFFNRVYGTRTATVYYFTNLDSVAYACSVDDNTLEFTLPCTATGSGFSNPHGIAIGADNAFIANFTTNTAVSSCNYSYINDQLSNCKDSTSGTFSNASAIIVYERQS